MLTWAEKLGELKLKVNPCPKKVRQDGLDSLLQLEDLESWENQYGLIPNGAVVIVHTGHGR